MVLMLWLTGIYVRIAYSVRYLFFLKKHKKSGKQVYRFRDNDVKSFNCIFCPIKSPKTKGALFKMMKLRKAANLPIRQPVTRKR